MQAVPKKLCPHKHGDIQVRACESPDNVKGCPVEVRCPGTWGEWGACDAPCGGGTQERKFTLAVDAKAATRGKEAIAAVEKAIAAAGCESERDKTEHRECNTHTCPDDCKGTWQEWEQCSASCGPDGYRRRVYAVNWKAKRGGAQCPHDDGEIEVEPCNRHTCPVNCVGEWTPWSECSRECGDGGHQSRKFRVTTHAAFGGEECPSGARDGAAEKRSCNTHDCKPGDCVGRWDAWSDCSARCGTGFQTRAYVVEKPAHHSGKPCSFHDGSLQSRSCNHQTCTVQCEGEWSEWSPCSAECGGGQRWRTYKITRFSEGKDAMACPIADGAVEVMACGMRSCPRDCVGEWGPWSRCSAACGGGQQLRHFVVLEPSENGGVPCAFGNHTEQHRACNEKPCNRDCVGAWDEWSECDVPCGGGGVRRRVYRVSRPHAAGGKRCEARDGFVQEDRECGSQPCVVNCEGKFTPWSTCSRECGPGGTSSRRFIITRREAGGGNVCRHAHETLETRPCNDKPCPKDCAGKWSRWSECSRSCGAGGMKKRIYSVVSQETDGGSVCPFADGAVDVKKCNEDVTCDSNCEGGWAPWGECSMGCHGGFQRRVYEIRKEASGRGARCQHIHGESETRKCPQDSCPVPCTGMWSGWSECSALCGGGIRNRTFELVSEALHGGECPGRAGEVQTKPCNTQECSHDCVGAFTPWSKCTRSCGEGGSQTRMFKVSQPVTGGRACEFDHGTVQEQSCNTHKRCPRDCQGNWTDWTECDARCGGGTSARIYHVMTPAQKGGKQCPYADKREDIRRCNEHSCDVDCFGEEITTDPP